MTNYAIPASKVECEYEVKKSRFIALLHPVSTRQDAMHFLAEARLRFPDARHHCWAYQLGHPNNPSSAAMSDDGEPSGTAGKPILNVIQHKDLSDLMVIIVRYFGGIKLGAGGLVRAYSSATQQAFEQVVIEHYVAKEQLKLSCEFDEEQKIRHHAKLLGGDIIDIAYTDKVSMSVEIEESKAPAFKASLDAIKHAVLLKS